MVERESRDLTSVLLRLSERKRRVSLSSRPKCLVSMARVFFSSMADSYW